MYFGGSQRKGAVFLERDGILIEDPGDIGGPQRINLLPETPLALRLLQRLFPLFIVTHHSGVARGIVDGSRMEQTNQTLLEKLFRLGISIERIYVCPHGPSHGCQFITPDPHHLLLASEEFQIDLGLSFVVGDHPHDLRLAIEAGATGVYVLTGYGRKHLGELPPQAIVSEGIWDAASTISRIALSREPSGPREEEMDKAASILRQGGVVAFPTETVYGLGANALDPKAVARIFEIKGRPRFDPLIVHLCDAGQARRLVASLPEMAKRLMERFWPGPLTLVLPKGEVVPEIVTGGLNSVAIRMPEHPVALEMIRRAGVPVAAPSANLFGHLSPTEASHVRAQLGGRIDMLLDGGPCPVGVESTVVSLLGQRPELLRAGGTTLEEIESVTGPILGSADGSMPPRSPGQLSRHYCPRTPLWMVESASGAPTGKKVGLLAFREPPHGKEFEAVEVLSSSGDLREAAANLFAAMHRLDVLGLDLIVAERVPGIGLGLAINDRLMRASRTTRAGTHRRN